VGKTVTIQTDISDEIRSRLN